MCSVISGSFSIDLLYLTSIVGTPSVAQRALQIGYTPAGGNTVPTPDTAQAQPRGQRDRTGIERTLFDQTAKEF